MFLQEQYRSKNQLKYLETQYTDLSCSNAWLLPWKPIKLISVCSLSALLSFYFLNIHLFGRNLR